MEQDINRFLNSLSRSPRTISTYRYALERFVQVVGENAKLDTVTYLKFLNSLSNNSASTQRVYTTPVLKFYRFCGAENWAELQEVTQNYRRKSGNSVVNFNRDAVEKVIKYCEALTGTGFSSLGPRLEALRDRAFVLTLADTGIRISEACSLKRSDIDWIERRCILTGNNQKRHVLRFSIRSIRTLEEYLEARSEVETNFQTPFAIQPLFARHDIRASRKLRPITAGGMWKAIKDRIVEAGLGRSEVRIHDFRHYFVAMTYFAKHDLKLSQELARHESISSTHRYIHLGKEADTAYDEIFNRKK